MTKFKNTYRQFLKYLDDRLSNTERYDFEKFIQQDDFEQDALEGFDLLKGKELEEDISFLNTQIQSKIKTEVKSFHFSKLGIVTSLMLIIGVGIFFLNKEKTGNTTHEINPEKLPNERTEILEDSLHTEMIFEDINDAEDGIKTLNANNTSIPIQKEINAKTEKKNIPKIISKTDSLNTITTEENILKEVKIHIPENASKKITKQVEKRVDSLDNVTSIHGVVFGLKGFPLSGVSVKIKETSIIVASNLDGKYSIRAKQQDTIQFSSLGYKTKEVLANNNLKIYLQRDLDKKKRKGAPPYNLNNKEESSKKKKTRKIKKNRVNIFRLKKGLSVKRQKVSKKSLILLDSTKTDTSKTKAKNDSINTIEDFGEWIDLRLNSSVFEPNEPYFFEISFEINPLQKIDQIKFHTNNDFKIQSELKRVLLSAPSWVLDVFDDYEKSERIDLELQIIF